MLFNNVDKLVSVPVNLSKLSDAIKNCVVKKDVYNAKTKNIEDIMPDIKNVSTNTDLDAKINEVKNEIPSITNLVFITALNAKINEVNNKIPNITNLTTTTALTAVEDKIRNVSNLVIRTYYNTKMSETTDCNNDKSVTIQEFNKLTSEKFTAILAQTNSASKSDIANFVKDRFSW